MDLLLYIRVAFMFCFKKIKTIIKCNHTLNYPQREHEAYLLQRGNYYYYLLYYIHYFLFSIYIFLCTGICRFNTP